MGGHTLPELLLVLVLVGIAAAIAGPPLRRSVHTVAVREGVERYAAIHHEARILAVTRGRQARIELDSTRHQATISLRNPTGSWDTIQSRPLGPAHLSTSRGTIAFSPLGLGFGASNATLVFSSGPSADTMTISRTGRLRRF